MANLKYYNNQTSKWEEIKVSTRFKELLNTKKLTADQNYVNIEITNYNPVEDVLFVILNSTWLQKDEDYVINGGLLRIESKDGSNWKSGDTFNFVVLKNVDKDDLPSADGSLIQNGSITITKLATSIQNYINKIGTAELNTIADDLSGAVNEIRLQLSNIVNTSGYINALNPCIYALAPLIEGNDSTNASSNTTKLQTIIDYCVSKYKTGEKVALFFPSGIYCLTNGIIVQDNISFIGQSASSQPTSVSGEIYKGGILRIERKEYQTY